MPLQFRLKIDFCRAVRILSAEIPPYKSNLFYLAGRCNQIVTAVGNHRLNLTKNLLSFRPINLID